MPLDMAMRGAYICIMTQTCKRKGTIRARRGCCDELGKFLPPRLFKALSDPTRIGLLVRIAEADELYTVGDLARETPIDMSVVSRHLGMLRDAGVIECVKHGKEVRCSLRKAAVVKTLRDLADALESCCAGRGLDSGEITTSKKE
jgi:ArsR family transcriptional regulator